MTDEKERSIGRRMEDRVSVNVSGKIDSLAQMIANQGTELLKIKSCVEKILSAFPDDDDGVEGTVSHRLYHMKKNQERKDSNKLRNALIEKMSGAGILGLLTIVGLSVWYYAQMKMGKQ